MGDQTVSRRAVGSTPAAHGLATRPAGRCPRAQAAGARIQTSCAVVVAPTLDRAFARWCLTVEGDRPRGWAAAYESDASDPCARAVATGSRPYHVPLLRRAVRRVNEARSALPVVR